MQQNGKIEPIRAQVDLPDANQAQRMQLAQAGNGISVEPQSNGVHMQQDPSNNKTEELPLFVTGRAVKTIQNQGDAQAHVPPNAAAFNPRLESPSLRRTSGFNHSTSAAVKRTSLGTAGPAVHPLPPMPQQQAAAQRGSVMNPQFDANRRIGMPGAAPSPLANRGGYKPPGPAPQKRSLDSGVRPPLADVSNVVADGDGAGVEVKRAKITGS